MGARAWKSRPPNPTFSPGNFIRKVRMADVIPELVERVARLVTVHDVLLTNPLAGGDGVLIAVDLGWRLNIGTAKSIIAALGGE